MDFPNDDYRPDIARDMYDKDKASQSLGIRILELGPGKAVVEMKVTNEMLNGLKTIHGGFLFVLADSAMAFASNQQEAPAFAIHAEIDFLKPVFVGTTLVATAEYAVQAGRTTVIDARIEAGPEWDLVAVFRGRTRTVHQARPGN